MAQSYQNHRRYSPVYHFFVYPALVVLLVASGVNYYEVYHSEGNVFDAALILGICIILPVMAMYARSFALKAQDRAIRAEENLRYFAITGKLLDSRLTMRQVIALRFAPNNELLDLAHLAIEKKLSSTEIKKLIKHWKEDNDRL